MMIFIAVKPMDYFTSEYPMWAEERQFVRDDAARSYSTLIIGDSRAKSGVKPGELDAAGDTYNIAIGGATPIEMYYALSSYLKGHEAPKRAFIIFAPYHFCDIDNFDQTLYYNYLDLGEILRLEKESASLGTDEKVGYKGWITDVISYKLRFPSKYLAAVYDAYPKGNGEKNNEKLSDIKAAYGHTLFGTDESNNEGSYETHHETFDSSKLVLEYYERLFELLEAEGAEIIVEQAPLNPYSHEHLYAEFVRGFEEYMEAVRLRHPQAVVVSEIPMYDAKFFGDNNHLNERGAEKFTQELKEKYYHMYLQH